MKIPSPPPSRVSPPKSPFAARTQPTEALPTSTHVPSPEAAEHLSPQVWGAYKRFDAKSLPTPPAQVTPEPAAAPPAHRPQAAAPSSKKPGWVWALQAMCAATLEVVGGLLEQEGHVLQDQSSQMSALPQAKARRRRLSCCACFRPKPKAAKGLKPMASSPQLYRRSGHIVSQPAQRRLSASRTSGFEPGPGSPA